MKMREKRMRDHTEAQVEKHESEVKDCTFKPVMQA